MSFFHDYKAPNLFPDVKRDMSVAELREHVSNRLVELAKENKLSITEILNQEERECEAAGMVILGQEINLSTRRIDKGVFVPLELSSYKVKVRSIEYNRGEKGQETKEKRPIQWKVGQRPAGFVKRGNARVEVMEDHVVDLGVNEAELSLSDAWHVLKQAGKYCRKLTSKRTQDKWWYYEEVKPNGAKNKSNRA